MVVFMLMVRAEPKDISMDLRDTKGDTIFNINIRPDRVDFGPIEVGTFGTTLAHNPRWNFPSKFAQNIFKAKIDFQKDG